MLSTLMDMKNMETMKNMGHMKNINIGRPKKYEGCERGDHMSVREICTMCKHEHSEEY